MNLSDKSINALALILTGDNKKSPYLSGPMLVDFFNKIGLAEIYDNDFPTRRIYAKDKLSEINNSRKIEEAINLIIDKRRFVDTNFNIKDVVEYLNTFLKSDGYFISETKDNYIIGSFDKYREIYNKSDVIHKEESLEKPVKKVIASAQTYTSVPKKENNRINIDKSKRKSSKKLTIGKIIGWIIIPSIAFLSLIIGLLTFLYNVNILPIKSSPKFEYRYDGVEDPKNPVFEVTQWMYSEENFNEYLDPFEINIKCLNPSEKYSGPAIIYINGQEFDRWDNFEDDFPLMMTPVKLFNFAGYEMEMLSINYPIDSLSEERIRSFTIDIKQIGLKDSLDHREITVKNTPWLHLTQIEDNAINKGGNILVNVLIRNFGDPSKFYVRYILYDFTKPKSGFDTLTEKTYWKEDDSGWWVEKSWPTIGKNIVETKEIITDGEDYIGFELPKDIPVESLEKYNYKNFEFEDKEVYLLEVRVGKNLPCVKFKKDDWLTSDYNWVLSDTPTYFTIVCLEKQDS